MFQRDVNFGVSKRLLNFGYKGLIFALVGFGAGIAGTAISNGLLLLRKKMDPDFKSQNKPPNVLFNAATWATHMGISSNLRYQVLNGIDMVSFCTSSHFRVYIVWNRRSKACHEVHSIRLIQHQSHCDDL